MGEAFRSSTLQFFIISYCDLESFIKNSPPRSQSHKQTPALKALNSVSVLMSSKAKGAWWPYKYSKGIYWLVSLYLLCLQTHRVCGTRLGECSLNQKHCVLCACVCALSGLTQSGSEPALTYLVCYGLKRMFGQGSKGLCMCMCVAEWKNHLCVYEVSWNKDVSV